MFMNRFLSLLGVGGLAVLLALLGGCKGFYSYYRKSADKEVYGIIDEKTVMVSGLEENFSIERLPEQLFRASDSGSTVALSLLDALDIAVLNSREYQSEREGLYSEGLALSLERHEWAPIFNSTVQANFTDDAGIQSRSRSAILGVRKMLATGADITASIAIDYLRITTGEDSRSNDGVINARLTQPLLRGFGRSVAMEGLTQAERSMVYALRDYVRFRKRFSVDIAKEYFRILQQQDRVANELDNWNRLRDSLIRDVERAKVGRLERFQVDQTAQDELTAKDRWIRETQDYENAVDNFKLRLGIPTDVLLDLDPAELERLQIARLDSFDVEQSECIGVAVEGRLDLKNTRARLEDSARRVKVAANNLLPGLDFTLDYDVASDLPLREFHFRDENDRISATFALELPLDRKSERNVYRRSLINLDAAERNYVEQLDRTKLDVRESWRNLKQAEQSYEIQKRSLELARQRVDNVAMLIDLGRAITRDELEAQRAFVNAQNALTSARVDHHNARLDLLLAMEALTIDESGFWKSDVAEKLALLRQEKESVVE